MTSPMMPWNRPAATPKQPLSLLGTLEAQQEMSWTCTPEHAPDALDRTVITSVEEAAARLDRFASWIAEAFPETAQSPHPGRIESALEPIADTQDYVSSLKASPCPVSCGSNAMTAFPSAVPSKPAVVSMRFSALRRTTLPLNNALTSPCPLPLPATSA